MSFLKYIIFLVAMSSVMSGLNGQESEPMDDSSIEMSEEDMTTELLSDKVVESSTEGIISEDIEVKTETISDLPEEVKDSEDMTYTPTTLQLSTESEESNMTSQYNVVDHNSSEIVSEFSCFHRSFGQYADIPSECRRFHFCYPFFNTTSDELLYQRITFECDDNTIFDQKRFICVHNSTVDHKCSDSVDLYEKSNQEFLVRVFAHPVPLNEEKVQLSGTEAMPNTGRGWFSWLSRG